MGDKRIRVNVQLTAETHRLLRMWCAEEVLTLRDGVEALLKQALQKVGLRVAAPPWMREPVAPVHTQAELQAQTPGRMVQPGEPITVHRTTREEIAANLHEMPKPSPNTMVPAGEPAVNAPAELPLGDWEKRCPQCNERMEKQFASCPECGFEFDTRLEYTRAVQVKADPEHVAIAQEYTVTSHAVIDENKADADADAFDPQAHYDEVRRKGLSHRSALEDTHRAIEYFFVEDRWPNWEPGAAPAANGHAPSPAAGPITAAEYEVPDTWVDNAGHTRKQNVERFGEDESVKYWPPGALI